MILTRLDNPVELHRIKLFHGTGIYTLPYYKRFRSFTVDDDGEIKLNMVIEHLAVDMEEPTTHIITVFNLKNGESETIDYERTNKEITIGWLKNMIEHKYNVPIVQIYAMFQGYRIDLEDGELLFGITFIYMKAY